MIGKNTKNRSYIFCLPAVIIISLLFIPITEKTIPEFSKYNLQIPSCGIKELYTSHDIEFSIFQLLQKYKTKGIEEAEAYAKKKEIDFADGMIKVLIYSNPTTDRIELSARNDSLQTKIKALNGIMEKSYLNMIQARLPIETMETIINDPDISFIGKVQKPFVREVISEGIEVIGAFPWMNLTPYRTMYDPVKIAVIDVGFEGYEELLGTELPSQVEAVSFRSEPYNTPHGTGCAEIIYDLVPDAEFFLISIQTIAEFYSAVEYCIENDIKVISMSMGYYNVGAGNGTGPLAEIYEYVYRNDMILALAGGNMADKHWLGDYSDPDNDGWTDFSDDDELCEFDGNKDERYAICLNWSDWGIWDGVSYSGTDQDFDLYLFHWNGNDWEIIDSSENIQDGGDLPIESLVGYFPESGRYAVGIKRLSCQKDIELEVFFLSGTSNREYNVPEYSIVNGDESPYIITVGAFYFYNLSLTPYSSQGPSKDGRITPDITAPTQVSTNSRGKYGTGGTSAAAPHVAGVVALILSRLPFSSFDDILSILEARAIDEEDPGKDNKWGFGRLNLH